MNVRTVRSRCLGLAATLFLVVGTSSMAAAQDVRPASEIAVPVRGTSTLIGQLDPGTTSSTNGIIRLRDSILVTLEESSDPRVSGRGTISLNLDAYAGVDGLPGTIQIRYGRMRLENDGGAWEGPFAGRLADGLFTQTYWLEGEGGYEGLSYVVTAGGDGPVWLSQGLIYPGDVPPLGGSVDFRIEGFPGGSPTA